MNATGRIPQDLCYPEKIKDKLLKTIFRLSEPTVGHLMDLPFMEWDEGEEETLKKKDEEQPQPQEEQEPKH